MTETDWRDRRCSCGRLMSCGLTMPSRSKLWRRCLICQVANALSAWTRDQNRLAAWENGEAIAAYDAPPPEGERLL